MHIYNLSKTLEKEINKDMGLKLEISNWLPFLNTAFNFENFYLVGKIHMYVTGELIKGLLIFKILTEISSYPWEFFVFKDLIIFFQSH